jgi:hypothetical protein
VSIEMDCPSCAAGNHADHDPRWGIRVGLIGGCYCGCVGDCEERFVAFSDRIFEMLDEIMNEGEADAH